jgi:hypothetical protein
MPDRIVFVKTGWSETYRGEPVKGRHSYLKIGQGHECYNFKPAQDGRYYGYVPPIGPTEASPKPDVETGWLVMFVATYRGSGRFTAVGWYEDAVFTPSYEPRPVYPDSAYDSNSKPFLYCISADQAYLIEPDQRKEGNIPGNHLRRSIAYVRGRGVPPDPWRDELARLAEDIVAGQGEHDGKARRLGFGGAPEGEEHRRLKEYVRSYPGQFGAPTHCTIEIEKRLRSNDEIDVWFGAANEQLAVEVKSVRSNELDLSRGIFQCVKYKAVLAAEALCEGSKPIIRSLLVSEKALPSQYAAQAELLGIKVQVIDPPT